MTASARFSSATPAGTAIAGETSNAAVRIMVVAGHPVLHGLTRLACAAIDGVIVVAEATSVVDARVALETELPDVLVMDVDLPDGDGFQILEELRELAAKAGTAQIPRILVLSHQEDGASVLAAMRLGATGYITKSDGLRGLTAALRGVVLGERVVPPHLESLAADQLGRFARRTRELAAAEHAFTVREREVLELLAHGHTLQQIGRRLSISPRTVETHARSIYRKLHVRTRLQAVSRAAAIGLIDLR